MWDKFKQRLGKFVQDIQKIFRKKKDYMQEWEAVTFSVGEGNCDEMHLGPGKITIIPSSKEGVISTSNEGQEVEELKKMLNTSLTVLPKVIPVEKLLLSVYASQPYEAVGVDLSRIDEGLAHYFCMSENSMQELTEHLPEEIEWIEESQESVTVLIPYALLIDLGDGIWTWDYQ